MVGVALINILNLVLAEHITNQKNGSHFNIASKLVKNLKPWLLEPLNLCPTTLDQ